MAAEVQYNVSTTASKKIARHQNQQNEKTVEANLKVGCLCAG